MLFNIVPDSKMRIRSILHE